MIESLKRIFWSVTPIITIILLLATSEPAAGAGRSFGKIDYDRFLNENRTRSIGSLHEDARRTRRAERYDSAAAYYSIIASRYSESLSDEDIRRCAIAYVNMGYIMQAWNMNTAEAYSWLQRGEEIARRHGLQDILTSITSNQGQIYFDYNNFHKGAEYLKKTLNEVIEQKTDIYFGIALADFMLAALFDDGRLIDKEIANAVDTYPLHRDARLYNYSRMLAAAMVKYADGDLEGAISVLRDNKLLPDIDTDRVRYEIIQALILGNVQFDAGHYREAEATVADVTSLCMNRGYYNLLEKCYSLMSECAAKAGDEPGSERYRMRALELRDSLFNASSYGAVKDLESAGALTRMTEKVKDETEKSARQRKITYMSLCISIVLLALFIWLYIRHHKIRNAYAEIFRKNMEITSHYLPMEVKPTAIPAPDVPEDVREDVPEPGEPDEETAGTLAVTSVEGNPEQPTEEDTALLQQVRDFMASSQQIYEPDFSIETLATLIGSRPKAVSHAINSVTGKNFNTILGEYRIRKACVLLADAAKMKTITMESVAASVGYRSRTYFSRVFKSVTGLTPTQFSNQARFAKQ